MAMPSEEAETEIEHGSTEYWRREAEESDSHEWCEDCESSYFAHFDSCPHCECRLVTDGSQSDRASNHVGPIVFADERARRQLVDDGEVITFRISDRTTGETWWRESRTGVKQGDCRVELLGPVDPADKCVLMAYYREAGFESVDAWQEAIRELNGDLSDGFLYRVTIPQQPLVTDGGEELDGEVDRIRVKCHGCHEPFVTDLLPLHETDSGYSAARYCPDCLETGNPLRKLETRGLATKQVENQRVCQEAK